MESHSEKLKDYVLMQILKGSSTLRLSRKGKNPFPKIIFRFGNQDRQIAEYLATKHFVEKDLSKKRI